MKKCKKCLILKPLSEFEISRNICKICRSIQKKSHYRLNRHKYLDNKKQYRAQNKEKINQNHANYYLINKEKVLIDKKSYYLKNKEQKKQYYLKNIHSISLIKRQYAKNKAPYFAAIAAKRRALRVQATPSWLNQTQHAQIESIYWLAKLLSKLFNIKFEVDHIVPLKGINCRGLHVPWNLQILTKSDNCSKGNKYG